MHGDDEDAFAFVLPTLETVALVLTDGDRTVGSELRAELHDEAGQQRPAS